MVAKAMRAAKKAAAPKAAAPKKAMKAMKAKKKWRSWKSAAVRLGCGIAPICSQKVQHNIGVKSGDRHC